MSAAEKAPPAPVAPALPHPTDLTDPAQAHRAPSPRRATGPTAPRAMAADVAADIVAAILLGTPQEALALVQEVYDAGASVGAGRLGRLGMCRACMARSLWRGRCVRCGAAAGQEGGGA